jgi:hypothetical protein
MDVNLQEDILRRAALLMEVRDLLGEPGPELGPSPAPAPAATDRVPAPAATPPTPLPPEVKTRLARMEGEIERLRAEIDALRREPPAVTDPAATALAGKAWDRSEAVSALLESVTAAFSANHEELRLRTERRWKRLTRLLAVAVLLGLSGIVLSVLASGWLHAGPWRMPGLDGARHAISAMLGAILPKP